MKRLQLLATLLSTGLAHLHAQASHVERVEAIYVLLH
jgi:hypothetical protein